MTLNKTIPHGASQHRMQNREDKEGKKVIWKTVKKYIHFSCILSRERGP